MNLESIRFGYLRYVVAPGMGAIGFGAAQGLALFAARAVHRLGTPGRRIAEQRVAAALGLTADDARVAEIVAGMYEHVGRFWAEALFLRRRLTASSWRRFVAVPDEGRLRAMKQDGRGVVLATAYFGNPAALAVSLGQIFKPVHVVADFFGQSMLRGWQREMMQMPGLRVIERADAAIAVPRVLERGGAVLMITENERPRGRAVAAPFLGRRLRCYPTLDRLSRWFGATVAAVTCRRMPGDYSFSLDLHSCVEPTAESVDGSVTEATLSALERAIMAEPDQYLWSQGAALSRC